MIENIQLTSGRKVYVARFECSGTYDGLLEGRPTIKINKSILEDSIAKARHLWSKKVASPVHIIEPVIPRPILTSNQNLYGMGKTNFILWRCASS